MKRSANSMQIIGLPRFNSVSGFSLVELLVATAIIMITLLGVTASLHSITGRGAAGMRENKKDAEIKDAFQLLQRDLNMAGFGLTVKTRIAEDSQYETAIESDFTPTYDPNGDGDYVDAITETNAKYDLNNDGVIDNAKMYRERLYIADGWTILKDVTDNNATDGNIVETPTDYYYMIAKKKEEGGYYATLHTDVSVNATSITVTSININTGDEITAGNDFKVDAAAIIYGKDSSGSFKLEGINIKTIDTKTLKFPPGETLSNSFKASDSVVVPAITWYVEKKSGDTTFWLYRNKDKVLPNVIGFQVSYGYDDENNGIQWFDNIPPQGPAGAKVDTLDVNANGNIPTLLDDLRAVRLVISVKRPGSAGNFVMFTYQKVVLLKN